MVLDYEQNVLKVREKGGNNLKMFVFLGNFGMANKNNFEILFYAS